MASYARCLCLFIFFLALSLSSQTEARHNWFFSKFYQTQENPENISISPSQAPSLAPAPSPNSEIFEHGYGLYGRDSVESTNVVGEVKHVEAKNLGEKKTFRDFVMAYPNENENDGWKKNENEKKGMSDTRFLENGKYFYDVNSEKKGDEKQGMSENVEGEENFPENKHGKREKQYLVHGKYYYGYVTGKENENGDEKQGMSEYVERENSFPESENKNEYENENEKKYFVNGKYYTGYVTGSKNNEHGNEKQGMSEYVERENNFPETKNKNEYEKENENENENEKKYFVNGKYYTGYVTGSKNIDHGNEKQEMREFVEDENSFPEYKENEYETENKGMGEKKYYVNGKYYTGYVTGSGKKGYDKKEMNEFVEKEESFPEYKENGNEYERENRGMGEKKYYVNGKYYSGYVTGNKNENENEKERMSEYVEEENNYPENKGNGYEYEGEKMGMREKKYLVNGKYYTGYVTGSENKQENNQKFNNFEDLSVFNRKNEHGNGYNENEFYEENDQNERERRGPYEYNPNEYENMGEYEKEQEYRASPNEYLP